MAIIGVLKRNTCHIEECNANPYKSTRWQDQQLENIAKDKGKAEADGLGHDHIQQNKTPKGWPQTTNNKKPANDIVSIRRMQPTNNMVD